MDFGISITLNFIQTHGYFIMFLLMLIEGPITTYIGAFASYLGFFDIYFVFILSVLGNVLGDLIFYAIGNFTRLTFRKKYKKYFDNKKLNSSLKNNTGKAMALIKILPPLPAPGLILAGALKVPIKKFIFYSFIISAPISLFFTLFGFYSGVAFNTSLKYFKLEGVISLIAVILIILWLVFFKIPGYLTNKYEGYK